MNCCFYVLFFLCTLTDCSEVHQICSKLYVLRSSLCQENQLVLTVKSRSNAEKSRVNRPLTLPTFDVPLVQASKLVVINIGLRFPLLLAQKLTVKFFKLICCEWPCFSLLGPFTQFVYISSVPQTTRPAYL